MDSDVNAHVVLLDRHSMSAPCRAPNTAAKLGIKDTITGKPLALTHSIKNQVGPLPGKCDEPKWGSKATDAKAAPKAPDPQAGATATPKTAPKNVPKSATKDSPTNVPNAASKEDANESPSGAPQVDPKGDTPAHTAKECAKAAPASTPEEAPTERIKAGQAAATENTAKECAKADQASAPKDAPKQDVKYGHAHAPKSAAKERAKASHASAPKDAPKEDAKSGPSAAQENTAKECAKARPTNAPKGTWSSPEPTVGASLPVNAHDSNAKQRDVNDQAMQLLDFPGESVLQAKEKKDAAKKAHAEAEVEAQKIVPIMTAVDKPYPRREGAREQDHGDERGQDEESFGESSSCPHGQVMRETNGPVPAGHENHAASGPAGVSPAPANPYVWQYIALQHHNRRPDIRPPGTGRTIARRPCPRRNCTWWVCSGSTCAWQA